MQSTETSGTDPACPRRSSKLGISALGILLTADAAAVVVFILSESSVSIAIAGAIYVALLFILAKRTTHPLELLGAFIIGGAPSVFLVLGLGGLVAIEMARLAGSNVHLTLRIVFDVLAGGTTLGICLIVSLAALAAAGVRRPWLPVAMMLLFPLIIGSSFTREALSSGVIVLNYALLAAGFSTFGAVVWPRVRTRGELEATRLDEKRKQEKNEPAAEPKPDDPEKTAIEAAESALEAQLAADLKGIGVALSGGGHRAALFYLGVLLYLVRAGRHREVAEIASVSGGSLTNGYVARSLSFRDCTVEDFNELAGRFARQLADKGTLFAYWQSKAYVVGLVLTGIVSLVGFAFWIRPPQWLPDTWLVPVTATLALVLLGYLLQQRGMLCRWAFSRGLYTSNGRPVRLSDLGAPPIHVFCATELQTGSGAYFLKAPFVVTRERGPIIEYFPTMVCNGFQTTIVDLELATAVQASASLPGAFPPVKLPVHGRSGIPLREVSKTWEVRPARYMLLVDGGVRDNLGVEWFLRGTVESTLLIVVSGAANKVRGRQARVSTPWLGDIRSLLLVKDLPYNTREQNRRQELLTRFLPSYRGAPGEMTGVILHIEESPDDLAERLVYSRVGVHATKWAATALHRVMDSWMFTPEDTRAVEALRQHPEFLAIRDRAAAVREHLQKSEDIDALRAARVSNARDEVGREHGLAAPTSVLVAGAWHRRVQHNSTVPTNLSKLGRPVAAELMRHAYALAMAKLHILFNFPLCDLPSVDELQRMMDAASHQ